MHEYKRFMFQGEKKSLKNLCVCDVVCVCFDCVCAVAREAGESPGAGVAGSCELPNLGTELRSSERVANTPNYITAAPKFLLVEHSSKCPLPLCPEISLPNLQPFLVHILIF